MPRFPQQHIAAALSQVWLQQWAALELQIPGAALGDEPEHLHRLRVALRKTRALLKIFKKDLPGVEVDHFIAEFKWLAGATGMVRDLDVLLAGLQVWLDGSGAEARLALRPVVGHLQDQRVSAQQRLRQLLEGRRFRRLASHWRALLISLPEHAAAIGAAPAREIVALRAAKQGLRLLCGALAIKRATPPQRLHRLRIRAKRLRYLLESFGPLLERHSGHRSFVGPLKKLQQELGDYRDSDLACVRVSALLEQNDWPDASPWLNAWREELTSRRRRARAAIGPAVKGFASACENASL